MMALRSLTRSTYQTKLLCPSGSSLYSFSQLSLLSFLSSVTFGTHAHLQNLEEELELYRKRVSEAEGVVKRAEEELAVAKERLLLQEDELQSRAGSLWSCPFILSVSSCLLPDFSLFLVALNSAFSSAHFHYSL